MKEITTFPKLVISEATALRDNTTTEEKDDLNFYELRPESPRFCIYGQLTGNCFSQRAIELIEKCAKRVYISEIGVIPANCKKLNGKPKPGEREVSGHTKYWSPIEVFIQRAPDEMNEKLIDFIKGTIPTLE